jgi:hypothetical protein
MFKKLSFKTLLFIFGGLLVLVVIMRLVQHSKGERNFKAKFFEVDTAKVSAIILKPRGEKEDIRIVRTGKSWNLESKGKTYKIEKNAVAQMLYELATMKPDHVAANDKSEWGTYEVTDSAASRVKVEEGGKQVADFLIGKVSFQQYQQTSYVRLPGEDDVYAVNGFLAMTFNRRADDLRDKSLVKINNPADITKLTFTYPDSSFSMLKDKDGWKINDVKMDSAKVASYLSTLSMINAQDFVSDAVPAGNQIFSLRVEGKNFQPVELKAASADTLNKYIITSNVNTDGRFSGAKGDLTSRIFVGANHFKVIAEKKKK